MSPRTPPEKKHSYQNTKWYPDQSSTSAVNIPIGGGENATKEKIESSNAEVVHRQAIKQTMTAAEIAQYILDRAKTDKRLDPIQILAKAELPVPLRVRVAYAIAKAKLKNKEEE